MNIVTQNMSLYFDVNFEQKAVKGEAVFTLIAKNTSIHVVEFDVHNVTDEESGMNLEFVKNKKGRSTNFKNN